MPLPASLDWHVWSSSSGNNCHAVHRPLSSGCINLWVYHRILPCPILSAKPTYAISSHNCHRNLSLPSSASLWNDMIGRVEGQYTTTVKCVSSPLWPQQNHSKLHNCTSRYQNIAKRLTCRSIMVKTFFSRHHWSSIFKNFRFYNTVVELIYIL